MYQCYNCKKYNECNKKKKLGNENCFVKGKPNIQKPCLKCKFYCGKDKDLGDLCSQNGNCTEYTDWFLSQNGWLKVVEPFRKLRAKKNE